MNQHLRSLHYLKAMGFSFYDDDLDKSDYNSLAELKSAIQNCHLCELSHLRLKNDNLNYFLNSKPIKLLFVTISAPKNKKNLQDFIKKYFELEVGSIRFCSVLRCPAPKIKQHCIDLCLPYLFNEIALLELSAVVLLGQECVRAVLGVELLRARGVAWDMFGTNVFASYDPDFILKNPSYEPEFQQDMIRIRSLL